jgi:hypothetical protein
MEKLGQFLPEKLTIPTQSLEELIKFVSARTVGKVLKRIEITEDRNVLKSQIKELLYEEYRGLTDLILALNYGLEFSEFKFKEKSKENV